MAASESCHRKRTFDQYVQEGIWDSERELERSRD